MISSITGARWRAYLILEFDWISQTSGVHWGSAIIDSRHSGVIFKFRMKVLDAAMAVEHRRAVG
jgi:hypothetical protein